jgi:hypothetical protein
MITDEKIPAETRLTIKYQGAPRVDYATIRERGRNVVAIDVHMHSKYCQPSCGISAPQNCPAIGVVAAQDSVGLAEGIAHTQPTGIIFADFPNWDLFAMSNTKYTLNICLIRKPQSER